MACMSLVIGFMPKSTLVRMPNTRLCYLQRRALIISAGSNPGVSKGGGPKINRGSKPKDAANTPKEKLTSGDSGKENKKISDEKVEDDTPMNNKATA
ncbi:hypothetical protein SADUNF_Sadunf16G0254800 [Salix dunnii]|uniref:Uncharacterized protein n=1 Tax=Salix dunnii TaxID=1413687 RepID=A0A835JAS7_9ROSI|nr:hypothetical protein SADUNF_Sadunf16G0254800 [Salix dunnii]